MTWTAADLAAVEDAIRELAAGERVVTVRYADGTENTYGQANLSDLRKLRQEMQGEVATAGRTYRAIRITPRSGY
ncbi:gpW family head-tail joining protein [Azospirillum rugosum]|uniref:SepF-like predicted cell division protein (DUF552 family) n=1 Tax=Azospirillum rugosum TaxID=416170 RepID=A0ABS4SEM3_9PROT|nr:gpW family head-tail joining protein [Azospirillum rugosum]MBP2291036.1 SepF-like predicted cell division protein (DUF552 family) [Azospirillum rugosum]MDQ0524900.1 SepF-like predicted cell division protein (DUF552 family) [Azospirillum rugosum]